MAKRKKNQPTDPAAIARKNYEARRNPALWGVNTEALTLEQNDAVRTEAATRQKVKRVTRFDCFALLESRGALDRGQLSAVRRLMEKIEVRWRVEAQRPAERVDGSTGPAIPVTDRSLDALRDIEAVLSLTGQMSARLLLALCEPAVRDGQPVNNWRDVVERVTGERFHHGQTALVKAACENLRLAWIEIDGGERRAA